MVIATFSTSSFSSDNTARFIVPFLHWLLPFAQEDLLEALHHVIRKGAHVGEYFVLGIFILRGIRAGRHEMRLAWALAAIAAVAVYAALDELHQGFAPGRDPEISDVLLDTSGGALAQAVAFLVLRPRRRTEQAQQANETPSEK